MFFIYVIQKFVTNRVKSIKIVLKHFLSAINRNEDRSNGGVCIYTKQNIKCRETEN